MNSFGRFGQYCKVFKKMKTHRREFLKKTTLAGAGIVLAMSPYSNVFGAVADGKKIRIAVIGPGSRGRLLLEYLLANGHTQSHEIVALCDDYQPSLDAAMKICARYKATPANYRDYLKVITEVQPDAVVLATPLHQHAHIAIDCLKAGIHVYCEKSMARTLDDAKAMYDAHLNSGAILIIGHQRLFSDKYLNAMNRIHQKEFGEIGQIKAHWERNNNWRRPVPDNQPWLEKKINWRLYKEFSAGMLTELMSHQLQVANWALQQNPVSVMATGSIQYYKDGREVPDNLAAIFSYANGVQFVYDNITMNGLDGCEETILCDYGTLRLETNNLRKENPPAAPGILQLVNDIEKGIFGKIQFGGASWVPETAVKYNGEEIYRGFEGDGTKEALLSFVGFAQKGSAPEWLLKEAYNSSLWTLLTEQAIDTGLKITCPKEYLI